MHTTKRLLVRFDTESKNPCAGDFLIPRYENGKLSLRGIKSGQYAEYGIIVFIGVAIKEHDLFAKLVDSGIYIGDVDRTIALLRSYVDQVALLKLGNVVQWVASEIDPHQFRLTVVATNERGFAP